MSLTIITFVCYVGCSRAPHAWIQYRTAISNACLKKRLGLSWWALAEAMAVAAAVHLGCKVWWVWLALNSPSQMAANINDHRDDEFHDSSSETSASTILPLSVIYSNSLGSSISVRSRPLYPIERTPLWYMYYEQMKLLYEFWWWHNHDDDNNDEYGVDKDDG